MDSTVDIKKQIEDNDYKRYTLSVVSGQERLVVENLIERVKKQSLQEDIVDYLVPIVPEVHYRKGKKYVKERKLYPWYVFVKSKMNEKIWYIIRNTPGVRLIVWAEVHPIPLTEKEYQDIIAQIKEKTDRLEHAVPFREGDIVLIKDGQFKWTQWVITEIDGNKWFLCINIEILGRPTSVMVPFEKVENVN